MVAGVTSGINRVGSSADFFSRLFSPPSLTGLWDIKCNLLILPLPVLVPLPVPVLISVPVPVLAPVLIPVPLSVLIPVPLSVLIPVTVPLPPLPEPEPVYNCFILKLK